MKTTIAASLSLLILFGGAGTSRAQVRKVEMRLGGYLCGN